MASSSNDLNLSLNSSTMQNPSFLPHTRAAMGGILKWWGSIFLADNVYRPLQLHSEWSGVALSMQLTVCVQSRVAIAASPMQSRIALSMQRVEEGRGNLPSKSCHSLSGPGPPPSPFFKEITTAVTNISMREGAKELWDKRDYCPPHISIRQPFSLQFPSHRCWEPPQARWDFPPKSCQASTIGNLLDQTNLLILFKATF